MRTIVTAFVTAAIMATSAPVFAQDQAENGQCSNTSSTGTNDRSQTFCFRPEPVAGSLVGSTGQSTRPIHRLQGPSLIRWRAHFVPEMLKSVESI